MPYYFFFCFIVLSTLLCYVTFLRKPKKHNKDPKTVMKSCNVIFAGTVRNVGPYLKKALHDIELCAQHFNDYAVVLYENDSEDDTRAIMLKYKKENYHYLLEDGVTEPTRTKRIAHGRNQIMEKIRKINRAGHYDYMIMLDLDDVNHSGMFVDTIATCFQYKDWDVLTANQTGTYYDLWALRKKGDMDHDCWMDVFQHPDDPDAVQKYVTSQLKHYPQQEQLLEVESAFGGAAVYRLASIPSRCAYVGSYEDGTQKCEHVEFNECIKRAGGRIYINTRFLTS